MDTPYVAYGNHRRNIDHAIIARNPTDARVDAENPLALLPYDQGRYFTPGSVGEAVTRSTANGPAATKKLLDIDELEATYGLKRWTIRLYCSQGKIPYIKIGRRVYFDPAAIDAWLQAHAHPVKEVHLP